MTAEVASNFGKIQGRAIHYLETGEPYSKSVLFLHGASFSAQTWQELGTLTLLAEKGYRAVAVDLPDYGSSENLSDSREEFLWECIECPDLNKPVLISPSMSGGYSLPFICDRSDHLSGFLPIAPVGILKFARQLQGIKLLTLAIWGSNDGIVPVEEADELLKRMPNDQKVILANAGHACYMKATEEFHEYFIKFIDRCLA